VDLGQYRIDGKFSPALVERERPDYVPEVGWFIELNSKDLSSNCIWCDGKMVGRVRKVCITASVDELGGLPWAEITISTPIRARVTTDQGTVTEVPLENFDGSLQDPRLQHLGTDLHALGIPATHCPQCGELISDIEKEVNKRCSACGYGFPS
jgi:hypothetical protein